MLKPVAGRFASGILLLSLFLFASCSNRSIPSDKLPEAAVEGKLSTDGSPFEGVVRLKEKYTMSGGAVTEQDEVTIYSRPGFIRREVKTNDKHAPVIGMIYKAGDTLVTVYGISAAGVQRHYRMSVTAFNEEKESGLLYMAPAGDVTYQYIKPYSCIFSKMKGGAGPMKDSVYNGRMGPLSLKANFYHLPSFMYCRAIWSP